MRENYIDLLSSTQRPGIWQLITYLDEETDFFTAPASTKYHGACPGGLLEHSLAVYDNLLKITKLYGLNCERDSLIICALLHDLCKANFYRSGIRNRKNLHSGKWEQVEVYEVSDQLPLGHGEKSVMVAQQYISLSPEEMLAIRWHMGGFDITATGMGGRSLSQAMSNHPIVAALHMADLAACYFDQK